MLYDIVIIGGGVIGGMMARELSKYKLKVCVLEKENDVACGATKANSGIIHGGYDPEPDTLKAKLNAEGVELLYKAAEELSVPFKNNRALVCAFSADEDEGVKELYWRGLKNGITEIKVISGDEARSIEKNLSKEVTSALYVKNSGIISPYELCIAAIGNAMDNGVELKRNFTVSKINATEEGYAVTSTNNDTVCGKYVINCAGCYSDKIANLVGDFSFQIIPRAGEYMLLDKEEGKSVDCTIFQVPTQKGKGILVTPTAEGNLLLGPTADKVDSPECNETTSNGLDSVIVGARKSVPSVKINKVITSFCGIRSSEKSGDFIIKESESAKNFINVAAIDSPGLTSSVAIAKYVINILNDLGVSFVSKESWNGLRESMCKFKEMNLEEKDAFIRENPEYGKIICRCETITEGEILSAIRTNPKALDVDSVKRRTRAGMGRCQGGFCTPYILKMISKENGISLEEVTKKGEGSEFLVGEI